MTNRTENKKPIVVRPKEGQSVIVLSPDKTAHRLHITQARISIEQTALDKLVRFVQKNADYLTAILGQDFNAKTDFAINLSVTKILQSLQQERRTEQEVVQIIYQTLHEAAKKSGESSGITDAKVRKLFRILKRLSQGKDTRI